MNLPVGFFYEDRRGSRERPNGLENELERGTAQDNPLRPLEIAIFFFLSLTVLLLFPFPGSHKWDGLMTATVLARWNETPLKEILFFAHPLVLPITKLFDLLLPWHDPLFVSTFRECFFAAATASLSYLIGFKLWGRLPALLMGLAYLLPFSHWMHTTWAEEKDIMMFFILLFLLPYLHYRGKVRFPLLDSIPAHFIRPFLGILLALSFMVHMEAALLVPFFIATTLIWKRREDSWRSLLLDLTMILAVSGILVLIFYGYIIIKVNGITTLAGARDWFLSYHYEFYPETSTAQKLLDSYYGFRTYFIGEGSAPTWLEFGLCLVLNLLIIIVALKRRFSLALACLIYIALYGANFINFAPRDPESWAGATFFLLILCGIFAFDGRPALRPIGLLLWSVLLLALTVHDVQYYRSEIATYAPLQEAVRKIDRSRFSWIERRIQEHAPDAMFVQIATPYLKPEALVSVGHRYIANNLLIYTSAEPLVLRYLDRSEEQLLHENHLSVLSMFFYRPHLNARELAFAVRMGRPLYHMTTGSFWDDGQPLPRLGFQPQPLLQVGPYTLFAVR